MSSTVTSTISYWLVPLSILFNVGDFKSQNYYKGAKVTKGIIEENFLDEKLLDSRLKGSSSLNHSG